MAYQPQFKVKATYMRGGTSKGTFFNIANLPKEALEDTRKRDKLLQRIVGSPDVYKNKWMEWEELLLLLQKLF